MTGVGDQQDIAGLCFERHVFQVSQYGFTGSFAVHQSGCLIAVSRCQFLHAAHVIYASG